jgi:molybdopterin/thiamine biosynthesis adenylyltransferase
MTWDRVERLIGADNLKRLAEKRVGIVGVGSGGGFVAQSLAMSGVGRFVLVDDDILEEANIVRHVADRRDLGRPKVDVVANLIRQRNPQAEIDVHIGRIQDHLDALDDLDLLIVGVDGEGTKYELNQACLERGLAAVYAGVYERGEGGDVVIIRPYDGPCYACWAAELREGLALAGDGEELDYGMIGPEGTLEAEPGLWVHVVRVAAVQTDFALKELLRETDFYSSLPGNTIILANNAIEIIADQMTLPHSAVWVSIERDPHCLVCGDRLRARDQAEAEQDAELSLDDLVGDAGIELQDDEKSQQMRQGNRPDSGGIR